MVAVCEQGRPNVDSGLSLSKKIVVSLSVFQDDNKAGETVSARQGKRITRQVVGMVTCTTSMETLCRVCGLAILIVVRWDTNPPTSIFRTKKP